MTHGIYLNIILCTTKKLSTQEAIFFDLCFDLWHWFVFSDNFLCEQGLLKEMIMVGELLSSLGANLRCTWSHRDTSRISYLIKAYLFNTIAPYSNKQLL